MSRFPLPAAAVGLVLAAGVLAQPAGDRGESDRLVALFPWQAPVAAPAGRLARLIVPPEVLAACRADLGDLRLFDAAGREVPYRLDSGWRAAAGLVSERTALPEVLATDRRRTDRTDGPPLFRERYELAPPPAGTAGAAWELHFATPRRTFVKRVDLAVADAGGDRPLGESASIFRLAESGAERTAVALPTAVQGGRLAVTLEGEDGDYLSPRFLYRTAHTVPGRERAPVPLAETGRRRLDGGRERRTELLLERPRGLVPAALRFATTTPALRREVEVWDEGPGRAAEALGRGTIFRVPAFSPVESLEISLAPARGDRLRVVIADGDSPALDGLAATALVDRPALLFSLPGEGGDGEAVATLRWGGGRAQPPRYDLAGLPGFGDLPAAGPQARVIAGLYDPEGSAEARLGPAAANPDYDSSPALAFAQRPGGPLEAGRLRYRRPFAAAPSADGLVKLPLAADDLAKARPDLSDLRIVDGEGRQWAYLLEREGRRGPLELHPAPPEHKDRTTRIELTPAVAPSQLGELTLDFEEPFFDRAYTLEAEPAGGGPRRTLARGRLVRPAGDPRPVAVAFEPLRLDRLTLTIADGDDAPLTLRTAQAEIALPDLFFAGPAGDYALLLGDPDADAPSYELARVRPLVLAVEAGSAAPLALEENPEFRRTAGLSSDRGLQQALVWGAIALATIVLAALTFRLARG